MKTQNQMLRITSENTNRRDNNSNALLTKHLLKPLEFIALVVAVYVTFTTSCANQGVGPSGGPKDSIPPEVVNSIPVAFQTQFTGKEIEIVFNEYVAIDNLSDKLTISPPLGKKPTIRTKGKSVVLKIEEDLIPDRTYAIDFGDGIKDYTEGNKVKNLRLVFSTGKTLDSLRISGYLYDAILMTPVKDAIATLYSVDNDSLFKNLHPDFMARTDDKGFFIFENLPAGEFKLYGLKDDDKNIYFSSSTELIAFNDTMISPSATYVQKTDTIISGTDTTISRGYTQFYPKEVSLLLFPDDDYSQYMVSFKRESKDRCLFVFSEPITDSIHIDLIGYDSISTWKEIEYSQKLDSVSLWITDSTLVKKDTLFFKVQHPETDSMSITTMKTDTLKMLYTKPSAAPKQGKSKPIPEDNYFKFSSNISSSNFDIDKQIYIEAPSPIKAPRAEIFSFNEIVNDSTTLPVDFKLKAIKGTKRKYQLEFSIKENTKYNLSLDTAVVKTLSGIPNAGFSTKFTTQKKDFYGSIILNLTGIERNGIIQVIKNGKQEILIKEIPYSPSMKTVRLDYIKPEKYLLKFIDDINGNGKWDTGKLSEKRQPEPIYYFEKEIDVKSNWEIKETWDIAPGSIKAKPVSSQPDEKKKPEENR